MQIVCMASTDSAIYLKIHVDRLISRFQQELKPVGYLLNYGVQKTVRDIMIEFLSLNPYLANSFF